MNYKAIKSKELIISLIKDDLRNVRLISGLSELGLGSDKYYLQLNRTILLLMGFDKEQRDDELYDKYNRSTEKISGVDIFDQPELLNDLALEIYKLLLKERKMRKLKVKIVKE